MRKPRKNKKRKGLNKMNIEKENIVKRIFKFFKAKKESGVFIKGKKLKIVDGSKIKISIKSLSDTTLTPIKEWFYKE
jgi:hypothetical protein